MSIDHPDPSTSLPSDPVSYHLEEALLRAEIAKAQEMDRRHIRQLAAVAEVGRAVTSNLDLQDLMRVLVRLLSESFGFYGVNVWLLTEPPDSVHLRSGFSPLGEDLERAEIQFAMQSENFITEVCASGEPLMCRVAFTGSAAVLQDHFPQAVCELVLPLKIGPKMVGALELISDHPDAFSEEDITLLRSLADQATIAIRNATLYQVEQSRRAFAETLFHIGRALSSTLNPDEVLDLILQELDRIVPSDRLAVMLREDDELVFVAAVGFPDSVQAEHLRVKVQNDRIYGQIFESHQPISIPDVQLYPDWQQIDELPLARSWLGVPLVVSGEVIGILSLARESLNSFSFSEVTLAQTFASQAAVALENARLYARLERFNQDLERMVRERTEALTEAYDRLERMDRTKTDFIKVTSHELRTPLTVMLGYSQMLLQNAGIMGDPMLSQLVSGIYSGADRMHEIVNSMLDIVKIENHTLELIPEPVSMGLLVRNVAGNFKNALRQRNILLSIEDSMADLPALDADPSALEKVFYQLLTNAIKYTPDGGVITVAGRTLGPAIDLPEGGVEILVRDSGIGIDPAHQELIFAKFYQTGEVALHSSSRTKFKGGGPGLGLPIARGIVLAHGGKLWAESDGHDETTFPGSRFYVILPFKRQPAALAAALT